MRKKRVATSPNGGDADTVPTTPLNRLALWITLRVGSMGFFVIIFIWTACWLSWNMLAPRSVRFDPYPGFVLWLFISNMIQLFLMPLILIGQNLQSKASDERAKNDYKINCKAEDEIKEIQASLKTILKHLEDSKSKDAR
jgi:uncharacterized membrane protein